MNLLVCLIWKLKFVISMYAQGYVPIVHIGFGNYLQFQASTGAFKCIPLRWGRTTVGKKLRLTDLIHDFNMHLAGGPSHIDTPSFQKGEVLLMTCLAPVVAIPSLSSLPGLDSWHPSKSRGLAGSWKGWLFDLTVSLLSTEILPVSSSDSWRT